MKVRILGYLKIFMKRLTACLTLRLLPGIGPITAQRLMAADGSTEAIFDSKTIPNSQPMSAF
jgi:hypothetical protein